MADEPFIFQQDNEPSYPAVYIVQKYLSVRGVAVLPKLAQNLDLKTLKKCSCLSKQVKSIKEEYENRIFDEWDQIPRYSIKTFMSPSRDE